MGRSARAILTVLVAMVAVLATASMSPGAHPLPALDSIAAEAAGYVGDLVSPAGGGDTADHAHDVPYAVFPTVPPRNGPRLSTWSPGAPLLAERENNILFDRPPRSL